MNFEMVVIDIGHSCEHFQWLQLHAQMLAESMERAHVSPHRDFWTCMNGLGWPPLACCCQVPSLHMHSMMIPSAGSSPEGEGGGGGGWVLRRLVMKIAAILSSCA